MSCNKNNKSQRQQAWEWILINSTFTCTQVKEATGVPHHIVYQFTLFLQKKKKVKLVRLGKGASPSKYKLVDASPMQFGRGTRKGFVHQTGRKKSVKQKCWNTMRILKRFTIGDIATGADVNKATASKYIRSLVMSGFIRCLQKPSNGNEHTIGSYLLIHNSGPLYPLNKLDVVIDQNTGEKHQYHPEVFEQGYTRKKAKKEPLNDQQKLA